MLSAKAPGYRPSLSKSPSSQQHESDILLTLPAFFKMTTCLECYCLQKAPHSGRNRGRKWFPWGSTEGSSISPDKGREQLGPLSDSAFGQTASAPGLLSPAPIYPSDGPDALRVPHSYNSGVVSAVAASPRVTASPAHHGESQKPATNPLDIQTAKLIRWQQGEWLLL